MDELQELLKQRKEINARITAIQNERKTLGCTKIDSFIGWGICDGKQISILTFSPEGHRKWKSIIQAKTKEELLPGIDSIVHDLEAMKERIKEDLRN